MLNITGLNTEHLSKSSFLELLQFMTEKLVFEKMHISQKKPINQSGQMSIADEHRFDIVLSGIKHMTYAFDSKIEDIFMRPGEVHYSPPYNWKWPVWDSFHEMSSILYGTNYIRITYINFSQSTNYYKNHGARIFYITSSPINREGLSLLTALNYLAERSENSYGHLLIKPLLLLTKEVLAQDQHRPLNKADYTLQRILNYLQQNFYTPINRALVADEFNLNPSYISRLFARKSELGFNATLRKLRLERAAMLLETSDMPVEEIAHHCGYLSSTFFIAAFKKFYNITPGAYRRNGDK